MTVQTIGVVGLGLLGRGIAASLLAHGFRVVGCDTDAEARQSAEAHVEHAIEELIARASFDPGLRDQWRSRYSATADVEAFSACDFVIETIVEDMDAKRSVYHELERVIGATVPIASNTSTVPITQLQARQQRPARFVGMHWAAPCHVTRFLEVTRGAQTSDAVFEAARALGEAAGKQPALIHKDIPGGVANRLGYAMFREALHLLEQGVADKQTIEAASRNAFGVWATIAGPLRWMDLTGTSLYAAGMASLFPTLSNATGVPQTMRRLAEENAQGIANGHGFFDYTEAQSAWWRRLLDEHAWRVRQIQDEARPPEKKESS